MPASGSSVTVTVPAHHVVAQLSLLLEPRAGSLGDDQAPVAQVSLCLQVGDVREVVGKGLAVRRVGERHGLRRSCTSHILWAPRAHDEPWDRPRSTSAPPSARRRGARVARPGPSAWDGASAGHPGPRATLVARPADAHGRQPAAPRHPLSGGRQPSHGALGRQERVRLWCVGTQIALAGGPVGRAGAADGRGCELRRATRRPVTFAVGPGCCTPRLTSRRPRPERLLAGGGSWWTAVRTAGRATARPRPSARLRRRPRRAQPGGVRVGSDRRQLVHDQLEA